MLRILHFLCLFFLAGLSSAEALGLPLQSEGWSPHVRERLKTIIEDGACKGHVAVFDLDETLLARDIADATFGILVRDRYLTKENIPSIFAPIVNVEGAKSSLEDAADLFEYGEWLLNATRHQEGDLSPNLSFFQWVVQIMAGLTCQQVIEATEKAYDSGSGKEDELQYPGDTKVWITDQKTFFLKPFFRPQMIELVGVLLENDYDVWVISATNVLMARWVVATGLNDLLRSKGYSKTVLPDHVIGISSVLQDDNDVFYKDYPLTKTDPGYLNMERQTLCRYTMTSLMAPPISGYSGKVAAMIERIGSTSYFGAGDSLSDHPFLKMCLHKLWIAKLEYPKLQESAVVSIYDDARYTWLVQPVLSKKAPCMVSSELQLNTILKGDPLLEEARCSLKFLQNAMP